MDAEMRDGLHRGEAVFAFKEPSDVRPTVRERAEHHGAMRNRLVARDGNFPGNAVGRFNEVRGHRGGSLEGAQRMALGYAPTTRYNDARRLSSASAVASGSRSAWPSTSMKNT